MTIISTDAYQKNFRRYRKYYYNNINPFLKSRRAAAYTMAILSLFAVSFFGFFAIRPTVKTIVELKRQIEDSKTVEAALQKKVNDLVIAQEEYQLIKEFVPLIDEALPADPDLGTALFKIEELASKYEATIAALQVASITYQTERATPAAKKTNNEPSQISISIKILGDYKQINTFLDKLLKTRRTLTTNGLELTPENFDNGTLRLTLRLNTYYLK